MKYLDTGSRHETDTLGNWFRTVLAEEIVELRIQTGFFSIEGIGILLPTLEKITKKNYPVKILIGSNDASTLRDDVAELVQILNIPKDSVQVGIVSFRDGYFHPKTFHVRRKDGTEAAFVGSANLTPQGLALHVEAGITLDTRESDDQHHLSQIATAIDCWFLEKRTGMTLVTGLPILDDLVKKGVLSLTPPPRATSSNEKDTTSDKVALPRLKRLFTLPKFNRTSQSQSTVSSPVAVTAALPIAPVTNQQSAPKTGFPSYFLFDTAATTPTSGINALSGTQLPGNAAGIIITISKDGARHFSGKTGTANITIPLPTVMSLRFGIGGKKNRPWAEFNIRARYIGHGGTISTQPSPTSVQAYGYTKGETSSENIRLGVLVAAISDIVQQIDKNGWNKPKAGDLALLEWPTTANPVFLLTFIEKSSALYSTASVLYNNAKTAKQLVGKSACWLPAGVAPIW